MIEDLQDEYIPSSYKNSKPNKAGMLLFVFIIWVIFSAVLVLVSKPKIDKALEETNAVEVFKNRKVISQQINSFETTLYFVNVKSYSEYNLIGYKTILENSGTSSLHDAIEGLLLGVSDIALKNGSVSFIPKGTKLIGASVSNGVAFVDLSEQFLSGDFALPFEHTDIAKKQILKTIQAVDSSVSKLVILVEGKEL